MVLFPSKISHGKYFFCKKRVQAGCTNTSASDLQPVSLLSTVACLLGFHVENQLGFLRAPVVQAAPYFSGLVFCLDSWMRG